MSEPTLETVEISLEHAQKVAATAKSTERLIANRDFKKIVHEGFFEKEAQRLVFLKSDPNQQSPEAQADIIKRIDAIGVFRQYIAGLLRMGAQAEKAIEDLEQTREEMLQEETEAGEGA